MPAEARLAQADKTFQDAPQMRFAKHDHVIRALADALSIAQVAHHQVRRALVHRHSANLLGREPE